MKNNKVHDHTEGEEKTRSGLASDECIQCGKTRMRYKSGKWEMKYISQKLSRY